MAKIERFGKRVYDEILRLATEADASEGVLLLTAEPRTGKSTMIQWLLQHFPHAKGFYSQERRGELNGENQRIGFEVRLLGNNENHLFATKHEEVAAHWKNPCSHKGYILNGEVFDEVLAPLIDASAKAGDLLFADELGPMQYKSPAFKTAVNNLLNSNAPVIGTIVEAPHPDADAVKNHQRVRIFTLVDEQKLLDQKLAKSSQYASDPDRFEMDALSLRLASEHGTRQITYSVADGFACDCECFRTFQFCSHCPAAFAIIEKAGLKLKKPHYVD